MLFPIIAKMQPEAQLLHRTKAGPGAWKWMEGGPHLCLKRDKRMVGDSLGEATKQPSSGGSVRGSATSLARLGFW